MLEFSEIVYGSEAYKAALALRNTVLRLPLGMTLSEEDTRDDHLNLHFGLFNLSGSLVACASLQPNDATSAQLRQMAVSADSQGQGLGRKLIQSIEAQASLRKYQAIRLNARVTAQPFYENCGYSALGEPFNHIGIPHVLMQKIL